MTLTEKQASYTYVKMSPDIQIEKYEKIETHTEKQKESVNVFIKRAIDETIEHDNEKLASTANIESEKKL